jgi:predicted short-subunit dehydrogenase-like oxidoreductase (DUF2520 family)
MMPKAIAIVGIGNLGWNFAKRLNALGYPVKQLISASGTDAALLAQEIDAELAQTPQDLSKEIDMVLLCVPDDVIASTAALMPKHVAVVHCSGSTPLITSHAKSGVLYAFQTFSKHRQPKWEGIPLFVEASDPDMLEGLKIMAKSLSGVVEVKSSTERAIIHLAGVFGANFVNHIIHQAEVILGDSSSSIQVLKPLLEETIRKAFDIGAHSGQTGPARRGDKRLIEQHVNALSNHPDAQLIYQVISNSIQAQYKQA